MVHSFYSEIQLEKMYEQVLKNEKYMMTLVHDLKNPIIGTNCYVEEILEIINK